MSAIDLSSRLRALIAPPPGIVAGRSSQSAVPPARPQQTCLRDHGWLALRFPPPRLLSLHVRLSVCRGTNPPQLQTYSPTEWRVGRSSVGGRRPPLIVVRLHVSYNTVYAESRRTAANCALPSADRTVCSMGMTLHIASLSTIAPVEYKPLLAARHGCHSKSKYSPY